MSRFSILFLFSAMIFFLFCGGNSSQETVVLRVPVTIEEVTNGDVASYISLTGTLLPAEEMPVTVEAPGDIHFRTFNLTPPKNGDSVSKGKLLAKIVSEEYLLNIRLDSKELALEQAKRDFAEKSKLGEMGGIAPREVEAAERSQLDAETSYQTALLDLEKMNVKAPMSGILTDMTSLTEGQRLTTGTQIGKVMNYTKVRCELNVTNDDIVNVKQGQEVLVTNFAYEDEPFTGYISKISPTIDPSSRTFKVEVEVDNPELRLRPGMFVKADIVVDRKTNVLTVPRYLIINRNNRNIVFVVEDQVAKERAITIGLQDAEYAEILEGLELGERLVIRGYETLKDNTKVRVSR